MKSNIFLSFSAILIVTLASCKKTFLEKKPSSEILAPSTLAELRSLLEGSEKINLTGALPQLSADEYTIVSDQAFLALSSPVQRNAYVWNKKLFEGEKSEDWNAPFQQIFYANSVLDILSKNTYTDITEAGRVKGWAHFVRGQAYYDLMKNFCKAYDPATASNTLGLPIRLEPGVDIVQPRATLKATFDQIISDLNLASALLDANSPASNKNRPSKAAAMALKSRIYLYTGMYDMAEKCADSTLILHNKLIDYNSISITSETPFLSNTDELIYQLNQTITFSTTTATGNRPDIEINSELYNLFSADDLRKVIFFRTNTIGKINMKRAYGNSGIYPFTGLAVDEIYLNKAEALARRNETTLAMDFLNQLLIKRFKKTVPFKPVVAKSSDEALSIILQERRKELIWRGIRWSDIKRLNRDGSNIILKRSINGKNYELLPNDSRYTFPIPDQEINFSGIQQN